MVEQFELTVVSNTPLTPLKDVDEVAAQFLASVGLLPKTMGARAAKDTIPYKIFIGCFVARPDRGWTAEEVAAKLRTTKPTVYRHIKRLKALDLLEEIDVPAERDTDFAAGQAVWVVRRGKGEAAVTEGTVGKSPKEGKVFLAGKGGGWVPVTTVFASRHEAEAAARGRATTPTRKGYRLRYGNLPQAWYFVEEHVKVAMENYRKTVEHLDHLVQGRT